MGCLSDTEIMYAINYGIIHVYPMVEYSKQLQPASLDLRLGSDFMVPRTDEKELHALGISHRTIDPRKHDASNFFRELNVEEGEPLELTPGMFVLGSTVETVGLTAEIVGRIDGRSSYGRLGVIVHSTAGFIDPGFRGRITLEFTNIGSHTVLLWPGERICQISFEKLERPSSKPYGFKRGSKYNGQLKVTASRVHLDKKI